jgi:sirohydrochlorin ferrochelatase
VVDIVLQRNSEQGSSECNTEANVTDIKLILLLFLLGYFFRKAIPRVRLLKNKVILYVVLMKNQQL